MVETVYLFRALWLPDRLQSHNHSMLIFSELFFHQKPCHIRSNWEQMLHYCWGFPGLNIFLFLLYPEEAIGSLIIEIPVILICLPVCKLNRSLTYFCYASLLMFFQQCKPWCELAVIHPLKRGWAKRHFWLLAAKQAFNKLSFRTG